MKLARWLSLAVILLLMFYLILTTLFIRFFRERAEIGAVTRTPPPTFTPTSLATAVVIIPTAPLNLISTPTSTPTPIPAPVEPSPTATGFLSPTPSPTPQPVGPQVIAASTVNVRAGPGTNYPVVAGLPANLPLPVTGRNNDASWWQITGPDGTAGWVANSVVQASNTAGVPVVAAPAPPPPTPTPIPPTPEKPQYQYEPTGWFADTNYGLTRFLGTITDLDGNPVNGVYVQASCGGFSAISNPSGPVGGINNEGADWPPGFYDLTLDTKPRPCQWHLTVVDTDDQRTVKATLSEPVLVEVTNESSVVTANWRKNW